MYKSRSTGSLELREEDLSIAKYPRLVEFENKYRDPDDESPVHDRLRGAIQKKIASYNCKDTLFQLFPFINTLKGYAVREDLPNDIIAGVTSGVMMIPQGMAFAALSTLPPIVGLYISFFASMTYFFFGTGRQLSWGCIAILSLMMANILDKYDSSVQEAVPLVCVNGTVQTISAGDSSNSLEDIVNISSITNSSTTVTPDSNGDSAMDKRIEVASSVSVIVGLIVIVASRIGLSRVTCIMSNSLITGFTVGISFHVATSQLKTIFGISVPRYTGIGAIVRTWIEILRKLPTTNVATLIISAISMLVIYLVKKFINERYKKKMRIPIPVELFVVIIATLISKYTYLHENHDVKVVKEVPVGVPAPKLPDLSLARDYIGDALVIIIIAYAQTLAMAKTMGLKHNYVIDSNQEMLACGACTLVCGLFSGYICAASVSRSVVQDGAGGKTQVASLFAGGLVLLVILLIGPYFYHLPMCVLSAIIVVNLRTMFLKLLVIPEEWRKSRYDCAVWVFSCVACIVLNADIGLLAAVVFALALVIFRSMLTPVVEAGQIQTSPLTVELRSVDNYSSAKRLHNIKIIKIKTPLYFVNSDIFTAKVFSKTGVDPVKLKKKWELQVKVSSSEDTAINSVQHKENGSMLTYSEEGEPRLKVVLLDASEVAFIDLMGVQALQFLINEFTSVNIEILITSVPENVIPMLKSTGFWKKNVDRLFISVEAALASIVTAVHSNDSHVDNGEEGE